MVRHRWLWRGVYVAVIVGIGVSLYLSSKRVDYTWRWERVPQYIVSVEGESLRAPFDGTAHIAADGRSVEIVARSDSSRVEKLDNADRVTVGEGDLVFEGDVVAIREGWAPGPLAWGLWVTLEISFLSLIGAIVIGVIAGLGR